MKLNIKVVPGSSRDCIVGWLGDALKIKTKTPAEHGKANAAVEKLVADALGVPKSAVSIISGGASSRKVIQIEGLSELDVRRKFEINP